MARPRTFDEQEVLEGAVEVFRELGYDGASVPALVERLGICRQSLYRSFGDKRGLYLAALARWGELEMDAKLALLEAPGSPLENVRTVVRGWADMAARCPGEGCLTARVVVEARDCPEALAVCESQVARFERGLRAALERAQAEGELKAEVRPTVLAHAIVTMAYGIGVLSRLPSSGPRLRDAIAVLLAMLDDAAA